MTPELGKPRSSGFALPAALFLLVVLGGLAAWLMQMGEATLASEALEIEGERAYQAAQAGLESAIYAVTQGGACAQTVTFTDELSRFTATVTCTSHSADEGGVAVNLVEIDSVACNQPASGACPNPDPSAVEYAERQIRAVVEQ
ncbi:MAG: agglutinin biogenesis protein MshP [Pseudomonadota bacterium]